MFFKRKRKKDRRAEVRSSEVKRREEKVYCTSTEICLLSVHYVTLNYN